MEQSAPELFTFLEIVYIIRQQQVFITQNLIEHDLDFSCLTRNQRRSYFIVFDSNLMALLERWDNTPLQNFEHREQRNLRRRIYNRITLLNRLALAI